MVMQGKLHYEELPSSQLFVLLSVSMHCFQDERLETVQDPCDVLLNVPKAGTQCGMHPTMVPCLTDLTSNCVRLCVCMCENIFTNDTFYKRLIF